MKIIAFAALCFFLTQAANAMKVEDAPVKCTSPDGKVTYQRGSCPAGSKIGVLNTGASSVETPSESWTYERSTDSMTGVTRCTAASPTFSIPGKRQYVSAQLTVVYLKTGGPFVLLANRSSGSVFHHDIRGTGLKVGDASMLPFGSRPTQTLLTFAPGTDSPIVESMHQYKTAQVRVRLWPWDATYDSLPISLSGFKQAYALAKHCSASL